ncbi:MAG: hypothetical protein AAF492_18040, partial [Verrucomicrobiota bacterium]
MTSLLFGVQYYYRLFVSLPTGEFWADESEPFKLPSSFIPENERAVAYSTNVFGGTDVLNADSATNSLEWSQVQLNNAVFAQTAPQTLSVLKSGDYFVAFTLPMRNINRSNSNARTAIRAELYVDGMPQGGLGAIGESSYIRGYLPANGHYQSSDHFATLVTNLASNAMVEVRVTSTLSNDSMVRIDTAQLYVERVDEGRTVFAATTTDGGQDMSPPFVEIRAVDWEDTHRQDTGFSHTSGSPDIILQEPGAYAVFVNMPYSASVGRDSSFLTVRMNGTPIPGGRAAQGYIRAITTHFNSSVHWAGLVHASSPGEVLSIFVQEETSISGSSPVANGKMSILVERLDDDAKFFSGRDELLHDNSSNWNPATAKYVRWQNVDHIHSGALGHNPGVMAHEITIQEAGDYLLVYNDVMTATGSPARRNPIITVVKNNADQPGGQTKTHYIRSTDGHNISSGSLVYFMGNMMVGDVIQLKVTKDDADG